MLFLTHMDGELSERRLVENELLFRELNQKVVQGLTELRELARTHDQPSLSPDTTQPIMFYCECSDLNCKKRILLSPKEYENIHKNNRKFIIVKGHQTPLVEQVVKRTLEYDVVEKNLEPSRAVSE